MIEPLRYRSLAKQLEFDEQEEVFACWACNQAGRGVVEAFFLCHGCAKKGIPRPFCETCFAEYHRRKRKKKDHKPHPIVRGDPVLVETELPGDEKHFPEVHDWVTVHYNVRVQGSDEILEDTLAIGKPLTFQSGCSGPCLHLQVLDCTGLAAADLLGSSDPYCVVYWSDKAVGRTSTRFMTLNPSWANQTFVLPLTQSFVDTLDDDEADALFSETAMLPRLRVEVFDFDRLGDHDFLGQVTMSDFDILQLLRKAREAGCDDPQIDVSLRPKQIRGSVGIKFAKNGHTGYIQIVSCQDLPNADPLGLSDPYCMVFWNDALIGGPNSQTAATAVVTTSESFALSQGSRVNPIADPILTPTGKTPHLNDTLNPEWQHEVFKFDLSSDCDGDVDCDSCSALRDGTLTIHVIDWDRFGGHDVLGHAIVPGQHLQDLAAKAERLGGVGLDDGDMEAIYAFAGRYQDACQRASAAKEVVEFCVGVPQQSEVQGKNGGDGAANPQLQPQPSADPEDPERGPAFEASEVQGDEAESSAELEYAMANVLSFDTDHGAEVEFIDTMVQTWIPLHEVPGLLLPDEDEDEEELSATRRNRGFFDRLYVLRDHWLHRRKGHEAESLGKMVCDTAMRGASLSWVKCDLPPEAKKQQSNVKGSLGMRVLYHTRGHVLRGFDVAVSHMSLGEQALVQVRPDYGYGEVFASSKLAPYSTLLYTVQLLGINGLSAVNHIRRRRAKEKLLDIGWGLSCFMQNCRAACGGRLSWQEVCSIPPRPKEEVDGDEYSEEDSSKGGLEDDATTQPSEGEDSPAPLAPPDALGSAGGGGAVGEEERMP